MAIVFASSIIATNEQISPPFMHVVGIRQAHAANVRTATPAP